MFHPLSAFTCGSLLLFLSTCFLSSSGKKTTKVPSEEDWGIIKDIDTKGKLNLKNRGWLSGLAVEEIKLTFERTFRGNRQLRQLGRG